MTKVMARVRVRLRAKVMVRVRVREREGGSSKDVLKQAGRAEQAKIPVEHTRS
jgi:hypothetical protein